MILEGEVPVRAFQHDGLPGGPNATYSEEERFSRQVLFAPLGVAGQQRLRSGHAAIVGCGATGAAAASLLTRAGIGRLTIVDRDFVEWSNLQRQVLFTEADAAEALPKAEAARRHLLEIDRTTQITAHIADLVPTNIAALLSGADILLDATDNFETRYLLNDFAVQTATPWIYAAAVGSYATTMNIVPGETEHRTACLACLFPEPPMGTVETCDTAGILNTAVNVVASLQVTEALKYLSGNAAAMRRSLWALDVWTGEHSEVAAEKPHVNCRVCGLGEFNHLQGVGRPHITLCGRNSVQIHEHARHVDFQELSLRLQPHGTVRFNALMLRFTYGVYTLSVFPDGRTVVQGTSDTARARTLYARFIGS